MRALLAGSARSSRRRPKGVQHTLSSLRPPLLPKWRRCIATIRKPLLLQLYIAHFAVAGGLTCLFHDVAGVSAVTPASFSRFTSDLEVRAVYSYGISDTADC